MNKTFHEEGRMQPLLHSTTSSIAYLTFVFMFLDNKP